MRLRTAAFPTFLVTVKPTRGASSLPRSSTSRRKNRPRRFSPRRTARNSSRLRNRVGAAGRGVLPVSGNGALSLRRKAACGHDYGGLQRLRGHPWWPSGRGNHAGACGRVWTADRYASFILTPRRAALLDTVTDATGAWPGDLGAIEIAPDLKTRACAGLSKRGWEVNRSLACRDRGGKLALASLQRMRHLKTRSTNRRLEKLYGK